MLKYYRIFFAFIFIISAFAVGASYIMEYSFGLLPCKLCYYQRWAYIALLGVCIFGKTFKQYKKLTCLLIIAILVIGAGTAFVHMAVEMDWLHLNLSCTSSFITQPSSIEEFKAMISGKEVVPCDLPRYKFLGVTIAGWNFIYSSVILFFALIVSIAFIPRIKYEERYGHDHGKKSQEACA